MHLKKQISSEQAFEMIAAGKTLKDMHVTGVFTCPNIDAFEYVFTAEDCIFEYVYAQNCHFVKPITLKDCIVFKCEFDCAYFLGGLSLDNCVFENYLDFQSGGHNKNGHPFSMIHNTFKGFVNFFDCWYESAVIIKNNDFQKGSNLLGLHATGLKTQFDIEPLIENNKGRLDLSDEGDWQDKTIYLR